MRRPGPQFAFDRARGMTLMELLVVLGIISVIAGVGVGLLRRTDRALTLDANAKLVRAALRLARNSAIDSGLGAIVRLDVENRLIASSVVEVGGNWHFEDGTGARNTKFEGGSFVSGGKLGRCLDLGSGGEVDLGVYPWYSAVHGLSVTLWCKPLALDDGVLVSREGGFKLFVREDGGLGADLRLGGEQADRIQIVTRPGLLGVDRWSRITLAYDRIEARIEVDGVLRARKAESRPLLRGDKGHLLLGGALDGFKGKVDELRYDVVLDEIEDRLSVGADLVPEGDLLVRFDGQGRLDDRYHRRGAVVQLESDRVSEDDDAAIESIRVELSGAIR